MPTSEHCDGPCAMWPVPQSDMGCVDDLRKLQSEKEDVEDMLIQERADFEEVYQ